MAAEAEPQTKAGVTAVDGSLAPLAATVPPALASGGCLASCDSLVATAADGLPTPAAAVVPPADVSSGSFAMCVSHFAAAGGTPAQLNSLLDTSPCAVPLDAAPLGSPTDSSQLDMQLDAAPLDAVQLSSDGSPLDAAQRGSRFDAAQLDLWFGASRPALVGRRLSPNLRDEPDRRPAGTPFSSSVPIKMRHPDREWRPSDSGCHHMAYS